MPLWPPRAVKKTQTMILIGTMDITRQRGAGDFYCPTCGLFREYILKSRRPFLTLYFIPTVPIGASELFVRCVTCRSNWDPSVLQLNAQTHRIAQDTQFGIEAYRAAILVVLHRGSIHEREIAALIAMSSRLMPEPIEREELGRLCSSAQKNGVTAVNYVRTMSRNWSTEQRQIALQAMFVAATAGAELDAASLSLLASLREALELTEREYEAAIEEAIAWEAN